MIVEKRRDGSYHISDIIDGYWVREIYYYCTKREAIKDFKKSRLTFSEASNGAETGNYESSIR